MKNAANGPENPLVRHLPGALGLLCAILLTITLVTCSGIADRALSDWVPSDDYGERAFESYTLVSEDAPEAPAITATPAISSGRPCGASARDTSFRQ